MFTKIHSAAVLGLDCIAITAEVDVSGSWPGFQIVGLPDASISEAKERIRTAWKNTKLRFPSNSRIVINLAPADVRKVGSAYDLPMAVGMYLAAEKVQTDVSDALFVGELALDGSLRPVSGVLPIVLFARDMGFSRVFLPKANADEARLVRGIELFAANSFESVRKHLLNEENITPLSPHKSLISKHPEYLRDMKDVKGQPFAKRALEIAAAGGHNVLLSGPPGSGKTLLARTMPSILPALSEEEAISITKIYSVAGLLKGKEGMIKKRPFRAPHHSCSIASLVGGGTYPRPGEISLAHHGILYLDELPEFSRSVLESLRQPLEDGIVTISRTQGTLSFPAGLTLIASQNPCPCGFFSDPEKKCTCSALQIARYQKKVSGPLLDRIDLHVEVGRLSFDTLATEKETEDSSTIRQRVEAARTLQVARFSEQPMQTNSQMTPAQIKQHCAIKKEASTLLRQAVTSMHLSARSYHRILKVARTIADLAGNKTLETVHVAEALQFREITRT